MWGFIRHLKSAIVLVSVRAGLSPSVPRALASFNPFPLSGSDASSSGEWEEEEEEEGGEADGGDGGEDEEGDGALRVGGRSG
jgi:hypothetical protein